MENFNLDWPQYGPYYLVGVEIFNFKSYRQKHLVGPFTNLTSITGPNGSGKSNLMDAICFAMAVKTDKLRIKNLKNLTDQSDQSINLSQSSESTQSQERIQVYVKLIFKSKLENFQDKMVTFTRSTNGKEKSSLYFVNNSNVTKANYEKELAKLGFNIKNKTFMIFQDTIHKLITCNPKDFTNILEEISGSLAYKQEYDHLKEQITGKEQELLTLTKKKKDLVQSRDFWQNLKTRGDKKKLLIREVEDNRLKIILLDLYQNQRDIQNIKMSLLNNQKITEEKSVELKVLEAEKLAIFNEKERIQHEKSILENKFREMEIDIFKKDKILYHSAKDNCIHAENRIKNAQLNKDQLIFQQKINQNLIETIQKEIEKLQTQIQNGKDNLTKMNFDEQTIEEYKNLKNKFLTEIAPLESDNFQNELKIQNLKQQKELIQRQKEAIENRLLTNDENDQLNKIKGDIKKIHNEQNILKQKNKELTLYLDKIKFDLLQNKKELDALNEELKIGYSVTKVNEKINKQTQFVKYLMDNYPGVHGRLKDLCQPIDKKYEVAIMTVMGKYLNAIVVDSNKTVELIFKNDGSQFIDHNEMFMALNVIKVAKIDEALRQIQIVPNVRLVYDLIKCNKSSCQMAVQFSVANTLLCDNQQDAIKVAYGTQRHFNVVTLDGMMFRANGRISVDFSKNRRIKQNSVWSNESYLEDVLKKKSLQNDLLKMINTKEETIEKLQQVENQLFCCDAKLEDLNKTKNNLLDKGRGMSQDEIQKQLTDLNKDLQDINSQWNECTKSFDEYQQQMNNVEQRIFADFLHKVNFPDLKQFEMVYLNLIDDDFLVECENRLKDLQIKLDIELKKEFKNRIEKWQELIETESANLIELRKSVEELQAKTRVNENSLEEVKKQIDARNEDLKKVCLQFENIQENYNNTKEILDSAHKTIQNCLSEQKSLLARRHEYYHQAHEEEYSLPFISKNDTNEMFINLFEGHHAQMPKEELYKLEDQILLDFNVHPEIQINNNVEYKEKKLMLETSIRQIEEEIKRLSLMSIIADQSSTSDILSRIVEIDKKISGLNKSIYKVNKEKNNLQKELFPIRKSRLDSFNSIFEKVSLNLNSIYKELMQSESAQAFVEPINSTEPYLDGLHFNCIVPGKTFKPLKCMSGGEMTLAMFSFIFALYSEKLPTFFIMDEIDRSLDVDNTIKLANFLKAKSSSTQFIMITLNPNIYNRVNSLIGVCKDVNRDYISSKAFSFDLRPFLDDDGDEAMEEDMDYDDFKDIFGDKAMSETF